MRDKRKFSTHPLPGVWVVRVLGTESGLRQGRMVPIARATRHINHQNAVNAVNGFLEKCERRGFETNLVIEEVTTIYN